MNEREELRQMMADHGLTYKKIAEITGLTHSSVKTRLQPNAEFPRWARLALYVWKNSVTNG